MYWITLHRVEWKIGGRISLEHEILNQPLNLNILGMMKKTYSASKKTPKRTKFVTQDFH